MNLKVSRHHHYLSQFYLRGFTNGRSKKSKLVVLDLAEKKIFESTPRNIGGVRDFNRIEIDGVAPDALERELAKFEDQVAKALKSVEIDEAFQGENKVYILNLIALLAVRSPERREYMREVQADLAMHTMDLALATKDRWESQMKKMNENGYKFKHDISYEEMKKFHESKEYKIEVAKEWQIHLEFAGAQAILPYLFNRKWLFVRRGQDVGPMITTDKPVVLLWKNPESVPELYKNSPGYGLRDTIVYFPLSQDAAIIGDFDGDERTMNTDEEYIAHLNTMIMHSAHRQLYAPKLGFSFVKNDGSIGKGNLLIQHLKRN